MCDLCAGGGVCVQETLLYRGAERIASVRQENECTRVCVAALQSCKKVLETPLCGSAFGGAAVPFADPAQPCLWGCGCGDPPLDPVLVDRWGNRGCRQLLPPQLRLGSELGNVGLAEQGEAVGRRAGPLAQRKVGVTPLQKLPAQLSEAEGARLVQTVGDCGVCG